MSMTSSQCDELRKAAQTYRGLGNHRAEQLLLDAADTISELRGALLVAASEHRELEAENAKLRDWVAQRTAKRVVVSNADTDHATGHCECGACGGAIDFWDKWCRHCGARMEEE